MYIGYRHFYPLIFFKQKLVLFHHFGNSTWPVAKGLFRSQHSHGQDGASKRFGTKSNKARICSASGVYPVTLNRSWMLPADSAQLQKNGGQALRTPRTKSFPWRWGVQNSGTLQPRSHTCVGCQGQKHALGEPASEAPKLSFTCETTAEPHRPKEPPEKFRAAENGNDRFLEQLLGARC